MVEKKYTTPSGATDEVAQVNCSFCDELISARAKKCKHCGETLDTGTKSRIVAFALAWILGGIGGHKFYLNRTGQGILYLVFCWTFIPGIIAFIEGIIYLTMKDEAFWQKYGWVKSSSSFAIF